MEITSKSYRVNESEIFYNLEIIYPIPTVLRVNIPKLMAKIPIAQPKITTLRLSKSIYCNDKECRPSVGSSKSDQNFVTIPKYPHQIVDFSEDCDICGNTMINRFHKFHVNIDHQDIRDMYISTK